MSFIFTLISIAIIFGIFYGFQDRDRSHEKVITVKHSYFNRLWLWPKDEHTRWEAEIDSNSIYAEDDSIGLYAEDNYNMTQTPEPTQREIDFCKEYISDLALLFPVAVSSIRLGWSQWFHESLPYSWKHEFRVSGFSVPTQGDFDSYWSITFYCLKTGCYLNIVIEKGVSRLESIDD